MTPFPHLSRALTLALLLALSALPAAAQAPGDAMAVARGRQVAEVWCANCHVVGTQARSGADAAPSFASIARRQPEAAALRTWLAQQHRNTMPNYNLAREDVDGVVAYILSLGR